MKEIKSKFKSCFEEDNLQKETVIFKTEDGKKLGEVTLRQLKRSEVLELEGKDNDEYLLKCIESWDFKDDKGETLEVSLDNLKRLTSAKKVGKEYAPGIINHLFEIMWEMNIVSEVAEKNSGRR